MTYKRRACRLPMGWIDLTGNELTEAIPPVFEPTPADPFLMPRVGDLVTVKYHEDPLTYETGVLVRTKGGRIRFYDEDSAKKPYEYEWHLTQKNFKRGGFRARPDLAVASRCYDHDTKRWCKLVAVEQDTGAVKVLYDGMTELEKISATHLTGNSCGRPTRVDPITPCISDQSGSDDANDGDDDDDVYLYDDEEDASTCLIACTPESLKRLAHPSLPPEFKVHPDDEYQKPNRGELVSYMYHKEPKLEYRVAVLCSGDGELRFYQGAGMRPYIDKFHMNKALFRKGMFRARTDLLVGRNCYDWNSRAYCKLEKIEIDDGSVMVRYMETAELAKISPDSLVGAPHPIEDYDSGRDNTTPPPKRKRPREASDPPYVGVYISEGDDRSERWYIRGKVQVQQDGQPRLLFGQCVRYRLDKPEEKPVVEYLEWDRKQKMHVKLVSKKDIERCEKVAFQAEEKHTQGGAIGECSTPGRKKQSNLRPMQPIHILGKGNGIFLSATVGGDMVRLLFGDTECMEATRKIRDIGYKPAKVNLHDFFRRLSCNKDTPNQQRSFHREPDHLYRTWKEASTDHHLEGKFNALVEERRLRRKVACGEGDGTSLTALGASRLRDRAQLLLDRLQTDFYEDASITQLQNTDIKQRITEIMDTSIRPNFLLLCGGFAPEIVAYKRLGAAVPKAVVLQDIDLHAVGVAVAAHPAIDFYIVCDKATKSESNPVGDIKTLSLDENVVRDIEVSLGGIHNVSITNPCQPFSLAGKKEGFDSLTGQLLHDCSTIVRKLKESSRMPIFLAENVPSFRKAKKGFDAYLPGSGTRYFAACASMCSPCIRKRRFATNRPPPVCLPIPQTNVGPPSLNGDLPKYQAQSVLKDPTSMLHPGLKKFPCLIHSKPGNDKQIWHQHDPYMEPEARGLTAEEAERALGYHDEEIGVTALTAENAILARIRSHDAELDGQLVSLAGCANNPDAPVEPVSEKRLLQLLGNSVSPTLLEALMWNDRKLFPPVPLESRNDGKNFERQTTNSRSSSHC